MARSERIPVRGRRTIPRCGRVVNRGSRAMPCPATTSDWTKRLSRSLTVRRMLRPVTCSTATGIESKGYRAGTPTHAKRLTSSGLRLFRAAKGCFSGTAISSGSRISRVLTRSEAPAGASPSHCGRSRCQHPEPVRRNLPQRDRNHRAPAESRCRPTRRTGAESGSRGTGQRADPDRSAGSAGGFIQPCLQLSDPLKNILSAVSQQLVSCREADPSGIRLHQLGSHVALSSAQLLRQRRGRAVSSSGYRCQTSSPGDVPQQLKMANLHVGRLQRHLTNNQ